jgi:hypothetical protein
MTAKMLNRQANKTHKESEVQKAKVKKVTILESKYADMFRRSNRETMTLREYMREIQYERNKSDSTYFVWHHESMQSRLVSARPSQCAVYASVPIGL